ncbi:MAG: hypothetical protein ACREVN_12180 [Gammaproteobacteria bacterium]
MRLARTGEVIENPFNHGFVLNARDYPEPAAAAPAPLDLDGEDAL